MEQAGFYWVAIVFWGLIVFGLFLWAWGLWKKSWKSLLMSGIALILPMLYFVGANNLFRFLALVPLIPFALAFYTKKRKI
ncbi:hypothetical protein [Gottfriedia acidiceleris]|uniref:hypothetical protein n=1 Tax=Gottfriedia acidiceleris TaxID=371036 RepID=UPI0030001262